MPINRRGLLGTAGLAALAGGAAGTAEAAATPAPYTPSAPTAADVERTLLNLARAHASPLGFDGQRFSGPAWRALVDEGLAAEFFLLGEEHGTVETPILARELFAALRPAGYDTLAIEISPPIAQDLDRAARGGLAGIAAFVAAWPPGPAFYFWRTEAELIAAVRAAVPADREALWGLDYEVTGDRRLIARLKAKAPASAGPALAALEAASAGAWAKWRATRNPAVLFSFSGDPQLARAVRAAWPRPDADAALILETLEQTLAINALFPTRNWDSNELRARFNRANLASFLNRAAARGRRPKVMFKMGESHLMRGVNWTGNFDVGSLTHEAAALRGGHAFSVLVGGGRGARHGVLNPTDMSVADAPVDMFAQLGLGFLIDGLGGEGPTLVDLRPLRAPLGSTARLKAFDNPQAARIINAYDALIAWPGTTATRMLVQAAG